MKIKDFQHAENLRFSSISLNVLFFFNSKVFEENKKLWRRVKMNFNNNLVFSKVDIKRKIKIPTKLDEELSELIGIIIGDGHITIDKKYSSHQIYVTGNLKEDIDYLNDWVNCLFFKIFNLNFKIMKYWKYNYFNAVVNSKLIAIFLNKSIGIPCNKKSDIVEVPKIILNSSKANKLAFIRGISDTDFCLTFKRRKLHSYPVIKGKFSSFKMVSQLFDLLKELEFRATTHEDIYLDKRFSQATKEKVVQLTGKVNLERWMSIIGFKNLRHYTKYQIWKKFGFCPPYTTLEQRNQILSGKLDPNSFYGK